MPSNPHKPEAIALRFLRNVHDDILPKVKSMEYKDLVMEVTIKAECGHKMVQKLIKHFYLETKKWKLLEGQLIQGDREE